MAQYKADNLYTGEAAGMETAGLGKWKYAVLFRLTSK